mmetsp:Transcript_39117/g.66673  ORF Transcript_39117/g.66673 Transcript_39117/m.66673 type:complete len:334 (-) Transcript_39117:115-1116(-)|eukprot:CAMPEP_0183765546 /NCGR_PEP_ID=MMETSP0739-20130205/11021_1 /TAXON_ID=385413 /ORGANISM="Thalassiosira miniscula, Strain CCMP1093" /LENGTH=333 /DNA_ID=CAMNT_0026004235 /DNA_START=15 /DNA_END=1016 /DNA_ORIENTATION=+
MADGKFHFHRRLLTFLLLLVFGAANAKRWSKKRLAIVAYGTLDRDAEPEAPWKGVSHEKHAAPPVEDSLYVSVQSLQRHVIEPSKRRGYDVDVFVHSWDAKDNATIKELYNATAHLIEASDEEDPYKSIEAGLGLMRSHAKKASVSYEWVLVVRHDIYFRVDFNLDSLNHALFYLGNWCHPTGEKSVAETGEAGALSCAKMEVFENDTAAVPEYWYLGNPKSMDQVFLGFTSNSGAMATDVGVNATTSKAIAGGRIYPLHDKQKIQIGRYLVHNIDYSLYRFINPNIEWLQYLNMTWRERNVYDLTMSHRSSVCGSTYCEFRSATNWAPGNDW